VEEEVGAFPGSVEWYMLSSLRELESEGKVIMEDPKVIVLNPESALLIYKATIHAVKDGKELVFSDYATTAFVKRDGKWKGAFQQHSRIQTIGAKA
jgi:hypothetical protein